MKEGNSIARSKYSSINFLSHWQLRHSLKMLGFEILDNSFLERIDVKVFYIDLFTLSAFEIKVVLKEP